MRMHGICNFFLPSPTDASLHDIHVFGNLRASDKRRPCGDMLHTCRGSRTVCGKKYSQIKENRTWMQVQIKLCS